VKTCTNLGGGDGLRIHHLEADEVNSEPHAGFVLDVEPERSLRREAKHLNKPRVGWRWGRNSELAAAAVAMDWEWQSRNSYVPLDYAGVWPVAFSRPS
jgi:hypothetical protein